MPPWNTPYRRSPLSRRGYPPSSRRHETYPTQWYNDNTFSDEDDDYSDLHDDSDGEDMPYRSLYGRQRSYATDYDESDEDEDFDGDDDDGYGDEDDYDDNDYDQYNHYGSGSYGFHQHRNRRGGW
jgi:hypothetical protein